MPAARTTELGGRRRARRGGGRRGRAGAGRRGRRRALPAALTAAAGPRRRSIARPTAASAVSAGSSSGSARGRPPTSCRAPGRWPRRRPRRRRASRAASDRGRAPRGQTHGACGAGVGGGAGAGRVGGVRGSAWRLASRGGWAVLRCESWKLAPKAVVGFQAVRKPLVGFPHKVPYLDRIYRDYGMFDPRKCQTLRNGAPVQMNRIRRLSVALTIAGVLGVAAPAAASATPTISISGATASYPLVSLLAAEVRQAQTAQDQVQDRPGRGAGRHQRRGREPRLDRRRLARSAADRPEGPRLLPDRQVRDLRGDEQIQHARQPHPVAAGVDLHRQDPQLEPGPGRDRQRHDRPDQPHVGRGRADELPDAAAGRQESLRRSPPNSPPRVCSARRSKTIRTRSASCPTTRRAGRGQLGRLQRRGLQQDDRDLRAVRRRRALLRGDARSARRASSASFIDWITKSTAARKIISSQWIPVN